MFGRGRGTVARIVQSGDLIPDNRLLGDESDLLEHEAIAHAVAEIALAARTPVNIALFGPWGSGKSSIYTMIEKRLADLSSHDLKIARYDAWKYGGKELKRNFVDSLALDLKLDKDPELSTGLDRAVSDTRIAFAQWLWKNKWSLLGGLVFAITVASLWVLLIAAALTVFAQSGFATAAKSLIPGVGTVFGLALVAALLGPKVLEGLTVTTETPAPEDADQFAKRFAKLVSKARGKKEFPLVVFIDELDRCAPTDVVATLRDLKTFLDQPNCAFIVAADREVIVRALREEVAQAKPVREEEPYYATPGAFLDKIFQHQISLPPLRARALTDFARALADAQPEGVWGEMRGVGSDCLDKAIFALIPVHVRSPRRVKVLLNNFATNVRIAEARGLPWLERVHEIAVLTVLQTEFPSVIADMRRVPRLLTYLRGGPQPESSDVQRIAEKYLLSPDGESSDGNAAAVDEIINDDDTDKGLRAQQNASETLRRQLHNYLNKIAAAKIQDPRPDLLYLKPAANRDLLPDPSLGDAIDYATDTAPSQVAASFADQDSATLAIAIPLLTIEGDNATGLGRTFAYEAACLLVERLEPNEFQVVADQVHPSLQAAITAGALSDEALPGALLIAAWASDSEAIRSFLSSSQAKNMAAELLSRFVPLLNYIPKNVSSAIAGLLGDRFDADPLPVLTALSDLPVATACDLWADISRPVVSVINRLELPPVEEPEASVAAAGTQPEAPEPTGDGVALLETLIEAAIRRDDGEPLVSDIFTSFQKRPAESPMVHWTRDNADRVVGPMGSAARKARHALIGIGAFRPGAWKRWGALLPSTEEGSADGDVQDLANGVIIDKLLPEFSADSSPLTPSELAELVARVSEWSVLDSGQIAEALTSVLEDMEWEDCAADELEALWSKKRGLFSATVELARKSGSTNLVAPLIADDLAGALTAHEIDESTVRQFVQACESLPIDVVRAVSERADRYEPPEELAASALHLRLALRSQVRGDALPVDDLLALEMADRSTLISGAWLELLPAADQVVRLLQEFPFAPAAIGEYACRLSIDDRSKLWIRADQTNQTDQLLSAIGQSGIGVQAVDHIRDAVAQLTRESDRSKKLRRLRLAKPVSEPGSAVAALQKACGALAGVLMGNNVSGDVRSAAELVCWAGGVPARNREQ